MNNEIQAKLMALGDRLESSFNKVNWGGCGEVALMVSKQLDLLGVKHDVALCHTWGSEDYKEEWTDDDIIEWSEFKQANGLSYAPPNNHVLIKLENGMLWDTENVYFSENDVVEVGGYNSVAGLVSGDTLELLTSELGEWNPTFDRSQIPAMQEMTREILS